MRPAVPGEVIALIANAFSPLGFDAGGNPVAAPTDRDLFDPYWPPGPEADPTNLPVPLFPLLDHAAIQLWIGDEILPVSMAARVRPGIDAVWVTIPANLIPAADGATLFEIKGSMWGNEVKTIGIPIQRAAGTPPVD